LPLLTKCTANGKSITVTSFYSGENLMSQKTENGFDSTRSSYTEYTYSGTDIASSKQYNGVTSADESKLTYSTEGSRNGNVYTSKGYIHSSGTKTQISETEITYDGEKVVSSISYSIISGTKKKSSEAKYTYDGAGRTASILKNSYLYNSDKLSSSSLTVYEYKDNSYTSKSYSKSDYTNGLTAEVTADAANLTSNGPTRTHEGGKLVKEETLTKDGTVTQTATYTYEGERLTSRVTDHADNTTSDSVVKIAYDDSKQTFTLTVYSGTTSVTESTPKVAVITYTYDGRSTNNFYMRNQDSFWYGKTVTSSKNNRSQYYPSYFYQTYTHFKTVLIESGIYFYSGPGL
jgi:hypothetical protein